VVPNVPAAPAVRSPDPGVPNVETVPGLRQRVIAEVHDVALGGHLGQAKTAEKMQRLFLWPGMIGDACMRTLRHARLACLRSKSPNQLPKVPVQPLPVPIRRWQSVSVDLITCLKPTRSGHDAVVVFVTDGALCAVVAACDSRAAGRFVFAARLSGTWHAREHLA
jgi:hypothetical protein